MATLPAFRTTAYQPCFTHTGINFFFLTVKREKRESRGQEMGCHIHLFEFQGRASGTGYFSRVRLLHQCSKKIHESKRPTQVYLLGQWEKLCRCRKGN